MSTLAYYIDSNRINESILKLKDQKLFHEEISFDQTFVLAFIEKELDKINDTIETLLKDYPINAEYNFSVTTMHLKFTGEFNLIINPIYASIVNEETLKKSILHEIAHYERGDLLRRSDPEDNDREINNKLKFSKILFKNNYFCYVLALCLFDDKVFF